MLTTDDPPKILCGERDTPDETLYHCQLNDKQVRDLAAGFVPRTVVADMMAMLDWLDEDNRRARRPVPKAKKRKQAA